MEQKLLEVPMKSDKKLRAKENSNETIELMKSR